MRPLLSALLLALGGLHAATLDAGPWSVDYAPGRIGAVRYQGAAVTAMTTLGVYKPGYTGARFGLDASAPEVTRAADGGTVTWRLNRPGQVDGRVTLTLAGGTATWRLEAAFAVDGPVEFGLILPSASVLRDDVAVFDAGTRHYEFEPGRRFEGVPVGETLRFETPAHASSWQLAGGGWVVQDFRTQGEQGLRLITTRTVPAGGGKVDLSATLSTTAYDQATAAQRKLVLGQRTRWVEGVTVPNTGFEDGPAGWNVPNNGAVVDDAAHGGKHAARLTVADPKTDNVYITRQVPVVGGRNYAARCFVRTQGVKPAEGKMSSVGAGLIVEWADKDGKWLAAGDYACDLFGDHDWTRRECAALRAPVDAGYAVVFLTLRGVGTAWFDDLELEQTHRALLLQSPLPNASLADNRPTLTWTDDPRAASYTVELSPNADFATDKTVKLATAEAFTPHARPDQRLAPGTWYWRVSAPGYDPSAAWAFTQTAAVNQDTTPPTIALLPSRVTRADEPLKVAVRDESGVQAVEARVGERTVPVTLTPGEGGATAAVAGGWADGLNPLTLTATDRAGNRGSVTQPVLCRPKPAQPVVIDAQGRYTVAGKPVFPFGIYQVSPQAMPTVKRAGFDVVHTYQWEGSQDEVAARAYLDAAQQAGLRVFIGFDRGGGSGRGMVQGNAQVIIQRVAALCDHPGLFCWYLFDEPEIANQYIPPRTLIAYADLIRQLDPYHTVVMTTWGKGMGAYRRSFDTHWTQAYTTPDGVVKQLEEHRGLLGPECPITLLVHSYDQQQTARLKQQQPVDPAQFKPDPEWLRAAAFAGLTQQVNGLWWWWYADGAKDWMTVSSVPAAWEALTGVVASVKSLEPVLTDAAPAENGKAGAAVVWWRKTVNGETTLIAVNTLEAPCRVKVPAPGAGAATVLQENRTAQRVAGELEDEFGRYAVHVYRWR